MAIIWLLLGAALVVIGAVFFAQNQEPVNLFFWNYLFSGVPIGLVGVVPALIGLLLGLLLGVPARVRAAWAGRRFSGQLQERDRTIGKLQERINELERDLAVARHAPPHVVVEEHRIPDVPDGAAPRGDLTAA